MPEYFSTLCKDRIEVRRGILAALLVLHSLDRSDIESCNLDRESSFELDDLTIEFENFRRSNSIFVKCNDAVRRTVVVICGCLTGVNNSSDRLTIVDKLLTISLRSF